MAEIMIYSGLAISSESACHVFRLSVKLSCFMHLQFYPFDNQTCNIRIESCEFPLFILYHGRGWVCYREGWSYPKGMDFDLFDNQACNIPIESYNFLSFTQFYCKPHLKFLLFSFTKIFFRFKLNWFNFAWNVPTRGQDSAWKHTCMAFKSSSAFLCQCQFSFLQLYLIYFLSFYSHLIENMFDCLHMWKYESSRKKHFKLI